MAKSDYIEAQDKPFGVQLLTFKNNIANYAVLLNLAAKQISDQAADADYFNYLVIGQDTTQNSAQQFTACKSIMRDGGVLPPGGGPVPPVLPAAVTLVAPGIEARFRALVKSIKSNTNYNVAMGLALGIEGAEQTAPDLTTVQPDFPVTVSGNQVIIGWGWAGLSAFLDMIRIEVDRGDGKGFVHLTDDITTGYTDNTPFPLVPTKWTYRGIYIVSDQPVGLWSKPVSIIVGG